MNIWGDGSAIRDFAYSEDLADGVILTLYYGTGKLDFLNLGGGKSYTIRKLVETLSSFLKFNYKFDVTKPSCFPKRVMDISNAKKIIGYKPQFTLKKGLEETWTWYLKNRKENKLRHNYFKK